MSLRSHYTRERVAATTTGREIDQVVRAFLLYLLGTTLFADTASSINMIFLMPLRDLDLVATYDWGSCALAYLYQSIDEIVHGARQFYDFWHVVLVFFFPPFLLILQTIILTY